MAGARQRLKASPSSAGQEDGCGARRDDRAALVCDIEVELHETGGDIDGDDAAATDQRFAQMGGPAVRIAEANQLVLLADPIQYHLGDPVTLQRSVDDDAGVPFGVDGVSLVVVNAVGIPDGRVVQEQADVGRRVSPLGNRSPIESSPIGGAVV